MYNSMYLLILPWVFALLVFPGKTSPSLLLHLPLACSCIVVAKWCTVATEFYRVSYIWQSHTAFLSPPRSLFLSPEKWSVTVKAVGKDSGETQWRKVGPDALVLVQCDPCSVVSQAPTGLSKRASIGFWCWQKLMRRKACIGNSI